MSTVSADFSDYLRSRSISPLAYQSMDASAKAALMADFQQTTGAGPDGRIAQALMSCSTENECDRFGKDDIIAELRRRGFSEVTAPRELEADEFRPSAYKPELIKILLNHNKRIAAVAQAKMRQTKTGLRYTQGALPSEATNPSMYDTKTGLLKEQYLTQDHHGLTAYDFKGDKWVVKYEPKLKGFGGDAKWHKYADEMGTGHEIGKNPDLLVGFYLLDKRGLPKVEQLNYLYDYGKGYKDKKGKTWILTCPNRKNKKSFSIHPSNCVVKKDGTFTMKWEPADGKKPWTKTAIPEGPEDRKFFLPDGSVVTGKELNKLSLEEIWRMMMLLELMEQGPNYQKKLKELGLGPYAHKQDMSGLPGQMKTTRRSTVLDPTERIEEEQKYVAAGLPKCEFPNPGFRCYTDSSIPGACVPHEGICFNSSYERPWDESKSHGMNPKMDWAKTRRNSIRAAGGFESEENYRLWKAQQDQRKALEATKRGGIAGGIDTSSINPGFGVSGAVENIGDFGSAKTPSPGMGADDDNMKTAV